MKLNLFIFFISTIAYSQIVFVDIENSVYDFLDRQHTRGIIKLDAETKPFSRIYIAAKLAELVSEDNYHKLNSIEREHLEFYKEEYFYELQSIAKDKSDLKKQRWYLYDHSDELFHLAFSPIAGYGLTATGDKSGHVQWWGASAFTSYSDWFGGSISLRDKGEFGDNVDRTKQFSPIRGAWVKGAPNGIEYTDVKSAISFNWDWGNVSLIKEYNQWGSGKSGQLILSDKAPSYPHLKLQLKPVEWFRFNYIHGWLNSLVFDSSAFYYSYPNSIEPRLRKEYLPKYIAANMFTFSVTDRLDISAGNSIVYAGDIRPEFLIPFMFFKFLDHNTGRGDVGDGNGQMYFDISFRYPDTYKFYTTLFIDVTEIRNLLENDFSNTWIGFTLGGTKVDLLIPNLDLNIEYTAITPWVYEHKDEATTYKHIDYYLGHWLGQNADQIRLDLKYNFLRGLAAGVYFERIRKGGLEDIYYAYAGLKEKDLPFLYEPLRKDFRFGLNVNYELIHDLNFSASYSYSDINDKNSENRTPDFLLGSKHSFSLVIFYGM